MEELLKLLFGAVYAFRFQDLLSLNSLSFHQNIDLCLLYFRMVEVIYLFWRLAN